MKTYKTSQAQKFTVDYATSLSSGHGHRKILVYIESERGDKKEFYSVTNNMPDFDEASDKEGQDKAEALFEIIESDLDGEICEWLNSLEDTDENEEFLNFYN